MPSLVTLRRSRCATATGLAAFLTAVILLPYLHAVRHRDDHVHTPDGTVYLTLGQQLLARYRAEVSAEGRWHRHGVQGLVHRHGPTLGNRAEVEGEAPDPGHGHGSLAHLGATLVPSPLVLVVARPASAGSPLPIASWDMAEVAVRHAPRSSQGPPA